MARDHREPLRPPGEFEPHSPRKVGIDVTPDAQLATAFGEVDELALGADQPAARIDEKERAPTEADASVPPSFWSSVRFDINCSTVRPGSSSGVTRKA